MKYFCVVLLVLFGMLVLLLLVPTLLLANDASAATVSIDPIYTWLNQGVSTLLEGVAMGISGWVMFIFHRYLTPWIGAQLESKARDSLNTALANGVAIALNKVQGAENLHSDVQVKGQLAAWAAQYAIDHAPAAVAKFGLDPNALALKALAYVPPAPTLVDTTGNLPAPRASVEVTPLPDIQKS